MEDTVDMINSQVSRGGFFAAVLALITAMVSRLSSAQDIVITPCRPKLRWGDPPPLCNGQCPNPDCDYMAPPLPEKLSLEQMPEQVELGMIVWAMDMPWAAKYRINRCPKCSTAYWQSPTKPTQ